MQRLKGLSRWIQAAEPGEPLPSAAATPTVATLRPGQDVTAVLACTHFPLLNEELGEAMPGVRFVDGGPGIARRIAFLTKDQPWPDNAPESIAVFTGAPPSPVLITSLHRFGLTEIVSIRH